jgi:hypothetical protein
MTQLPTRIDVALQVPVTVNAADGKEAERTKVTLRRPKVRHAKTLAGLIGQDLVEILTAEPAKDAQKGDQKADKVDAMALGKQILGRLMERESLDGVTALIADLCNEDVAVIDDIDLIDLPAVAMAFAGFFPALRSAMSGASGETSSSSGDSIQ